MRIKNFSPLIFAIISIFIGTFFWDFIKLPYDENNIVQGTSFNKKLNPYNNLLRVLFFILLPIFAFFFTFIFQKNLNSINPINKNFFLKDDLPDAKIDSQNFKIINYLTIFFIIFVYLEFLSLDFKRLLTPIDIYHDGLVLVPSLNFLFFKDYWLSTHFDWGIGANLRPLIVWKIFGTESLGAVRFLDQVLILVNKILLIFICRKISLILIKKNFSFIFFFILLTLGTINLSQYFISLNGTGGPPFPLRMFPFLIFFLFLSYNFQKNNSYLLSTLIGLFSSISFFWFTDVAIYLNFILILYLIIIFFLRQYNKLYFSIFGIILSWVLFLIIFGSAQISEMFYQISSNMKFIYYFNFLEFPKPFSDHYASSRGLKSLLLIIINSIFCIYFCLTRKFISIEAKILIILTLLSSVVFFKSAIVRADAYHLKYSSGLIIFLFYINILLILFNNKIYEKILKNVHFKKVIILPSILTILLSILLFKGDLNIKSIKENLFFNINNVIYKDKNHYLDFKPNMWNYGRIYSKENFEEDKEFINYYKDLTENDTCVQNFTEYLSISYFLSKPTCTIFYNPQFIQHGITDKKFLKKFQNNMPEFILYSSPIKFVDKYGNLQQNQLMDGIPRVDKFLKKNYLFYESFAGKWVILKKIKKN